MAATKKKSIKKAEPKKPQWRRPFRVTLDLQFSPDSRKVVQADLDRATLAAATAARTVLEGTRQPYEIERAEAEGEYVYLQSRRRFDV